MNTPASSTRSQVQPKIGDTPRMPISLAPERDRFETELLRIATAEALRAQKPPLRRSELARRDYVPEPVQAPQIKRLWFNALKTFIERAVLLLSLTAFLALMWAGGRWIDRHTRYGVLDTEALRPKSVAQVQREQFYRLPFLPPPWKWVCLPFSVSTDAWGRRSFWVAVRFRSVIHSQDNLPKTGEIGDYYVLADRSAAYVWMVPFGAKTAAASWVDP